MRHFVVAAAIVLIQGLIAATSLAQTAMSTMNTAGLSTKPSDTGDAKLGSPANNPWLPSAQVAFKLLETGSLSDALLVSAQLLYVIPMNNSKITFPIMGNIGDLATEVGSGKTERDTLKAKTAALLSKAEGLHVSLEPYWVALDKPNVLGTWFLRAGFKANDLPDTAGTRRMLLQGRFGAGFEFQLGKRADGLRPLTISVLAGVNTFSKSTYQEVFGESREHIWIGELTFMIPIGGGTGLLFEGVTAEEHSPSWRLGFLVSKSEKSGDSETPAEIRREK